MTNYHFETREFGVSDNGIHLLRSRFNYETIEFKDVDTLTIETGKELNNWIIILIVGLALVSISTWYSFRVFNAIGNNDMNTIYIEQIVLPLIPLMLGGYCLYSSTRNGMILRVRTINNKVDKFPLKEIEKANRVQPFQEYLKGKLNTKVKIHL